MATPRTVNNVGIIGGAGQYGTLFRHLIRRCTDSVNVYSYDEAAVPDGRAFVQLKKLRYCEVVIFAVPADKFSRALSDFLALDDVREDMVLVNVCSDQEPSGRTLKELAGNHPYVSFHTPWGPQGYKDVQGVISMLPPMVITQREIADFAANNMGTFLQKHGFKYVFGDAHEHDKQLAGRWMFAAHLITQILDFMGLLDEDVSAAPLSFQRIVEGAKMLRGDKKLFLNLWARVPECHRTFDRVMAAAQSLAAEMRKLNGKH